MTVSATYAHELTVSQLLRRSFQVAGLLYSGSQTDPDDLAMARDILAIEMDSLHSDGVILRFFERTTQALTSSTASYTLGTDVIDVAVDPNNQAGTVYTASGVETAVRAISRAEYLAVADKTTPGTPVLVYVEKLATTSLTFWPVPDASMTFRYAKFRLPFDSDGDATLDLARRWSKAILYAMAWQLASAKSIALDKVRDLRGVAKEERKLAKLNEAESPHAQMFVERY